MARHVLGINWYAHDAAAALVRDGRLIFAGAEERFSRVRKDNSFPKRSIEAALSHAGIEYAELDAIAHGWNGPLRTPLHTLACSVSGSLPRHGEFVGRALSGLLSERGSRSVERHLRRVFGAPPMPGVQYIDHHLAHAYSAYAPSGFDDAIVLVVDGRGAYQSTSLYHARGDSIRRVRWLAYPNSLGLLYETFTDLLGFERHSDEWKVMGLAAYGTPTVPMDEYIRITPDGYRVNARALMGRSWGDLSPLIARFGPRRDPDTAIADVDRDIAASVQRAVEEAMFALVRDAVARIPSRSLCLAGGVAMNSKANGKLLAAGIVDRLFIQPAATDDGTAIGAALAAEHQLTGRMPSWVMEHAYLGPEVTQDDIDTALRLYGIPHLRCPNMPGVAARLLAEGKILGWFQGRMEFGPRALGNRSILADPRDPTMKDRVNACIKFREGWRPFAPSVLAERFHDYFEPGVPSPFMILTHTVRWDKRAVIPAITHVDGSARIQTVERAVNPTYWELISAFERQTGVPMIMNTSFNLRGEAIVCEPKDAIRTFYSSGLDFLALGDCLLAKDQNALVRIEALSETADPPAHTVAVLDPMPLHG
ncbi:MAG: hypothetical protein IT305_01750 [Chloroflexi bacterium]|nr:hypothetical protein [Chloroflexota bacterium]